MDVVRYLSDMVGVDSVSALSNLPMVEYLEAHLRRAGFECERHPYDDGSKINLVARRGTGSLALVGHTDTVPYDPAWTEALVLTERDGRLYGRGSADTKGFIAAVLAAVSQTTEPVTCIFTADEEIGCVGAKRLAQEGTVRPRFAIVGEPTQLRPVRAHKGYFLAEVIVLGEEAHSAYPHLGRSAILHAGWLLSALENVAEALQEEKDPDFDPPYTTLNVGLITGGKARNVIPGECTFPLEWRPIPGQEPEAVTRLLYEAIATLEERDSTFAARFAVVRRDPAVSTPADSALVRFLEEQTGQPSATIPFGTELPYLAALGAQGCVFGPGDIRVAHKTGEYVPRAELEQAADILTRAIRRLASMD